MLLLIDEGVIEMGQRLYAFVFALLTDLTIQRDMGLSSYSL